MTETRKIPTTDLSIEAWTLDRLKPAENNHKTHTEESVARLATSLADIGQIQPVIVDKHCEIIAGHGRWFAAQKLGWEKIKVIQLPVDRDVAIKARIADNLMSNGNIDNDKLTAELMELGDLVETFDVSTLIADAKHANMIDALLEEDLKINNDAMSSDIAQDVDQFSQETDSLMSAAEDADTPLRKIFGFNTVKPDQAIILKDLVALAIAETGYDDPADALVRWAEDYVT